MFNITEKVLSQFKAKEIFSRNHENIFSFGATITKALSRFLFVFMASILLSKYEFGIFNIFLSIYFFARLFSENSLHIPFIKFSSDGKYEVGKVNFHVIVLKIVYVTVVSIILLSFSDYIVNYSGLERKTIIYLMPLALMSLTGYMFFGQVLVAKLKMRPLFFYESISCCIFLVCIASSLLLVNQFTTEVLVWLFSLSMIISGVAGAIMLRKHITVTVNSFDIHLIKDVATYSKYTVLSGISSLVILKADVLMLGYFHNPGLVGIYGIALFVNEAVNVIFDTILRICLPKASSLSEGGNTQEIKKLFGRSIKNIYIGIIPIIIVIFCLAPTVIERIYGNKYDESIPAVYIFLLASLVKPVGNVAGMILAGTGHIKYDNRNCLIAAILNLVCNYYSIPQYGILGAAVSSLISFVCLTILHYISYRKKVLKI